VSTQTQMSELDRQLGESLLRRLFDKYGYATLVLTALVLAWEIGALVTHQPERVLPRPSVVGWTLLDQWNILMVHGMVTLVEVVLGFALSVAVGIPLAIAIVYSEVLERILYPILLASQAVPKIAIAPLFVIWLGFDLTPKIVIAFLIAFFPIVIDTVVGLRSIDPEMLQLAQSMGTAGVKSFIKLRLPNALPHLFAGLKVAITLAVVGAIVGEFVGADQGLGYLLQVAAGNLNAPLLFAALVVLSLMAILLFLAIEGIERLLLPWHISQRSRQAN
jgi:NitT/TauT family transport system permease protein